MTDDERELQAAEYVLGTLDGPSRAAMERVLGEDAEMRARVAAWQARLAPLEEAQPGIEPPARLWDALQAAIGPADSEAPPLTVVRADQRQWRALAPGIDWLPLHRAPDQGWHTFLIRFAPGARLPPHRHAFPEECILLEGDLRIGDDRFGVGDYVIAPAGSRHPRVVSDGGAIAYLRAAIDEAA